MTSILVGWLPRLRLFIPRPRQPAPSALAINEACSSRGCALLLLVPLSFGLEALVATQLFVSKASASGKWRPMRSRARPAWSNPCWPGIADPHRRMELDPEMLFCLASLAWIDSLE